MYMYTVNLVLETPGGTYLEKKILLPFVPFQGLSITEEADACIFTSFAISHSHLIDWNQESKMFECFVNWLIGDGPAMPEEEIIQILTERDWQLAE